MELNLSESKIRNIDILLQGLCRAKKLRALNLNLNSTLIGSIEDVAISNFENLKCLQLELASTPIYDIESFAGYLSSLQKLEELTLNMAQTKMKSLQALGDNLPTQLCSLDLSVEGTLVNNISELSLQKLVALDALTLNFNDTGLQNVDNLGEAIQQMKELRYLRLQFRNTQINSIEILCNKIGYCSSLLTIQLNLEHTPLLSI